MNPWLITLIIVVIIYAIIILAIGIYVKILLRFFKKQETVIGILIAQKYDLLISLAYYLKDNKIELSNDLEEELLGNSNTSTRIKQTTERLILKNLLSELAGAVFYIAETNGMKQDSRYKMIRSSILESDINYRREVAIYNSQRMAYNYWIKFLLFRPFSLIFNLKEKELRY